MEPMQDPFETEVPSTSEVIQDFIQSGRVMFAAGQRMIRDLDRLRGSAAAEGEWRVELTEHPYFWIGVSVGACLLMAAMFRPRE
jgi:alpha-beta hydrolase superfamily lysophospholipase